MARALPQRIRGQHRFEPPDRLVVPRRARGRPRSDPWWLPAAAPPAEPLRCWRTPRRRTRRTPARARTPSPGRADPRPPRAPCPGERAPHPPARPNRAESTSPEVHLEQVAGGAGEDPDGVGGASRPDRCSQPRHQVVHRARWISRHLANPQPVAEPIDRHDFAGMHQQHGEQPADPRPPAQGGFTVRGVEFHGAEHPDTDGHAAQCAGRGGGSRMSPELIRRIARLLSVRTNWSACRPGGVEMRRPAVDGRSGGAGPISGRLRRAHRCRSRRTRVCE